MPADLRLLTGPVHGRFDPPVNLHWQPGELEFSDPGALRRFYSSALTSACAADDYAQWIDRESLSCLWTSLAIPSHVRAAWETIHPTLRDESMTVNDRMDVGLFDAAYEVIISACRQHGWIAETTINESFRRQIRVDAGTGTPVKVDVVYHAGSGTAPERRAGGGLRLVFEDVVGGKAAAISDAPRGRYFDDLARIVDTPGWSLARVEDAMGGIGHADQVAGFRTNMARFRSGDFDPIIREEGFDPALRHRLLDGAS